MWSATLGPMTGKNPPPRPKRRRKAAPRRRTPSRVPYGAEHAAARKMLLEMFRDGTPCPRCRRPMRYWQKLDAGHVIPRMIGGGLGGWRLEHARCNRSAGATMGNQARSKRAQVAGMKRAVERKARADKW